jgi:hypothetical protein
MLEKQKWYHVVQVICISLQWGPNSGLCVCQVSPLPLSYTFNLFFSFLTQQNKISRLYKETHIIPFILFYYFVVLMLGKCSTTKLHLQAMLLL